MASGFALSARLIYHSCSRANSTWTDYEKPISHIQKNLRKYFYAYNKPLLLITCRKREKKHTLYTDIIIIVVIIVVIIVIIIIIIIIILSNEY